MGKKIPNFINHIKNGQYSINYKNNTHYRELIRPITAEIQDGKPKTAVWIWLTKNDVMYRKRHLSLPSGRYGCHKNKFQISPIVMEGNTTRMKKTDIPVVDLIIGGGKYGEHAFEILKTENTAIIVVDTDPACALRTNRHLPEITVKEFGESGLPPADAGFIQGGIAEAADVIARCRPERIFPTVPVHVAAGVISAIGGFRPDPHGAAAMDARIPDTLVVGRYEADVYCSLNHEGRCPDRCPAPAVCPATGIRREIPLFTLLREYLPAEPAPDTGKISIPGVVIESQQFGPGLGYLRTDDLIHAASALRGGKTAWVATACRCHGVATALTRDD